MKSPLHLGSLSFLSLFALGFASLGIGALERAMAQFRELTSAKTPIGSDAKLAENPDAQSAIGFAYASSLAAWSCIERCAQILARVASGEVILIGSVESVELKALSTFAFRTVFEAAQRLFAASGTTVIHNGHPLTRTLQDISALCQHVHGRVSNYREIGVYNLTGEIRFIL